MKRYSPYAIGTLFYNYGEPLLNLNTPKLIRMAKAWLMETVDFHHPFGSRFDAEAYVESGLDFMDLSIDGATQPVYERFRRNGDLELVLGNLAQAGGRETSAEETLSRFRLEFPGVRT